MRDNTAITFNRRRTDNTTAKRRKTDKDLQNAAPKPKN